MNLIEHKNIVKILWKNNNRINIIKITPSYQHDLHGSKHKADNIFTLFNNTSFMNPKTIILNGFIFFSSSQFITFIDTISKWENIIFRDCTIHTNKDLMLKKDYGLDLGILIKLQGWTYSKISEFKSNKVLKILNIDHLNYKLNTVTKNSYICKKLIVKKH